MVIGTGVPRVFALRTISNSDVKTHIKECRRTRVDLMAAPDRRKFQVRCDAGSPGRFEVGTDTLSVRVGQRLRAGKEEEMWDSVHILCKQHEDGSLTVEVLVCHPDWEEPQKVASIHSRPQDSHAVPTLKCDLEFPRSGELHRASGAR